jgi:uncharacterized protein (TIGR00299 family) protein
MRLCYIDAFSGLAGDMIVGALLDAGADFAALEAALASLGTGASLRTEKVKRRGISATKFHVEGGEQKAHRHLHHIVKMIDGSALSDAVKASSKAVFARLGEAEAKVHGVSIEKVHFHEVGAVDSICDIVGACFCLDNLKIERIECSPLNVGSGTIDTEHGLLPVPTPATTELLAGKPVYSRGPQTELTTPTGAAIATGLAAAFGPLPPSTPMAVGYGAGDKEFDTHANVVRVIIAETNEAPESVTVSVIETNLDDTTPQVLGYAVDKLLEAGALDVTLTPLFMKKNRPGTMLTVIARPEDQEALAALVLRETSALGLRIHTAERRVESREWVPVDTKYGTLRIKVSGSGNFTPEYEDCRRAAAERGVALKEVLAEANFAYLKKIR